MKNLASFLMKATRKSRPVLQQLELPLPGSRLTREESGFLVEIRRMRDHLAKA